jgi:hypothetical protein
MANASWRAAGRKRMSGGFPEISGSGRGYTRRLQLFVDALVDEFSAFIEIFVRVGLLGSHPAFPCCARVRHWLGICDRRRRRGRSRYIACRGAGGVGLATGECQCAGDKQHGSCSKKIAELYDHGLHRTLSEEPNLLMVAPRGGGYLPEKIDIRNGIKRGLTIACVTVNRH